MVLLFETQNGENLKERDVQVGIIRAQFDALWDPLKLRQVLALGQEEFDGIKCLEVQMLIFFVGQN